MGTHIQECIVQGATVEIRGLWVGVGQGSELAGMGRGTVTRGVQVLTAQEGTGTKEVQAPRGTVSTNVQALAAREGAVTMEVQDPGDITQRKVGYRRRKWVTMVLVGSEESEEEDDLIWITVDEVAGESCQPHVAQREEEGAGRKRKRQDEEEAQTACPDHGRLLHGKAAGHFRQGPGGVHWFHTYEILRNRTPTTDWVTVVILSFGINDKAYASAEAVGKLVKNTLGVAESTFPNAQIYILSINFNRHLLKEQCNTLNRINAHIASTGRALEVLPYE
ncbi:hypothetical protein DPX16_21480 [Anabarilius grahami]|uniref:Uncharacterized protein n=1 Tax=Anabarilius grahami TaxID=495550 RepID=A0A3N0XUI9_ANAGA|nr:hypothetical protein DPX16_21480 [Anabarilius grahami]